jgi:hypothetical protein
MRNAARAAIMSEELPARSVSFVALFLAMSSLPGTVHPNDADVPEFPFVLEPELEKLVRASLETTASSAARFFEGDLRVSRRVDTTATLETMSNQPPRTEEQRPRNYIS